MLLSALVQLKLAKFCIEKHMFNTDKALSAWFAHVVMDIRVGQGLLTKYALARNLRVAFTLPEDNLSNLLRNLQKVSVLKRCDDGCLGSDW